ncbi:helix-turn-helix transcriptional regulator [Cryptosporangium japonicum]|uniref:HTH luxR-type domain-containing protein n=1 Tax=Cryptosporangium japonicum TaxID=80872 RepID=A0ABP3D547_9ACTN
MALVEREQQCEVLTTLYRKCRNGSSGIAIVGGPIGSGKSALLEHTGQLFRGGAAVHLAAQCSATESTMQFSVLDQLFQTSGIQVLVPDKETAEPSARTRRSVRRTLDRLAAESPLVITVDDAHHADEASLACLLYAARRLARARILFILTTRTETGQWSGGLLSEFLYLPQATYLPVEPISLVGAATFLEEAGGEPVEAEELASDCHRITGGSPALMQALVKDSLWSRRPHGERRRTLRPGRHFAQSVRHGLDRSAGSARDVARAAAILGDAREPELLLEIASLSPVVTESAIRSLHDLALLEDGRFRHEQIRTAVLDGIPPEARSRLHTDAAEVLHRHGAPVRRVAEHLMASGEVDRPWIRSTLTEAAAQALAGEDGDGAVRLLHRALSASSEDERAETTALLAEAEWQVDPDTATRHLPVLTTAARQGRLDEVHSRAPVRLLLWQGQGAAAAQVLRRFPGSGAALRLPRRLLRCLYPDHFRLAEAAATPPAAAETAVGLQAAGVLHRVFVGGPDEASVADAEQVLDFLHIAHAPATGMMPLLMALIVLIVADRADRAADWYDRVVPPGDRRTPVHRALGAGVRAAISIRTGEFPAAQTQARRALAVLPARSWGVGVGLPLASLLRALTAENRFQEALQVLRHPVPAGMFQTPVGVLYLHARGDYLLAAGQHRAALEDFQHCGSLLRRWSFERSGLVPWRTDAARAQIGLGHPDAATALLTTELASLSALQHTDRGRALCVLASVSEPSRRLRLLDEAVATLQRSPNPHELVRAQDELTAARGRSGAGRSPARRTVPEPSAPRTLSKSEFRVACLVAQGQTNREIAKALFITISTVEQHLTRVYRKLNVRCRSDLPTALFASAADVT